MDLTLSQMQSMGLRIRYSRTARYTFGQAVAQVAAVSSNRKLLAWVGR